jgi:hypothetical protein
MTAFDWCPKCDTKHDLDEPCDVPLSPDKIITVQQ